MKRIHLVLFVLYIKNSVIHGTSVVNNSYSKNENSPQWYSKGKSISRESYVDPTASQSQQPQQYPTSFDNGGSEYNSVVPSAETSKYYYKIYPQQNQQQPQPYYQQASNNFQQYPSAYGQPPDEATNKQSFLDGLGLSSLGNLGSSFGLGGGGGGGGLSSLFGGGDGGGGGGFGGLGNGLQGLTGGLGNGLQGLTGGLGGFGGGGGDSYGVSDGAGAGISGIGSLAGPAVAGLFGLKGLKGLGLIGTAILLFVLGPVLLVLIAFPIAMITVGVLAFPVLQLRLPPDVNNVRSLKTSLKDTARFARDVLQSEECVERLSCTIANYTRSMPLQNWLTAKLERSQNKWLHRVSRSVKVATTGQDCLQFTCTPASHIRRMFRTYVFGEAKKLK